jgi:thiol-disulfide isomerase/thioredoxin
VTGSPLPTHTEGTQDPAVGMTAPVLRGASFDATPVFFGGDGKATLVVFVAHWCLHCQRELPVLASWLEDGKLSPSVSLSVVSTRPAGIGRAGHPRPGCAKSA